MPRMVILVGTRKGAFLVEPDGRSVVHRRTAGDNT